jgi:hypothetical protein
MKKTRAKKSKVNSHKKSNKPISSFFKKYFPVFLVVGILLLAAMFLNVTNSTGNVITGYDAQELGSKATGVASVSIVQGSWAETWEFLGSNGVFAQIFMYIFGAPISAEAINVVSAGIITIAVWLLIFITFSDIIASFSSFNKGVAWGIGFLISVIAANLGFVVKMTAWFIGAFAFLSGLAVIVGLLAAFVAFIAINIGVGKFAEWALKRRAVLSAHQASAGGKKLAGAIEGMGEIEKALARLGVKS